MLVVVITRRSGTRRAARSSDADVRRRGAAGSPSRRSQVAATGRNPAALMNVSARCETPPCAMPKCAMRSFTSNPSTRCRKRSLSLPTIQQIAAAAVAVLARRRNTAGSPVATRASSRRHAVRYSTSSRSSQHASVSPSTSATLSWTSTAMPAQSKSSSGSGRSSRARSASSPPAASRERLAHHAAVVAEIEGRRSRRRPGRCRPPPIDPRDRSPPIAARSAIGPCGRASGSCGGSPARRRSTAASVSRVRSGRMPRSAWQNRTNARSRSGAFDR